MSSCQSFLRQRVVGTTTLAPVASQQLYVFVADAAAGNYVGNYPPGYMSAVTVFVESGSIFRDMGKTIKAGIGSGSPLSIGSAGFFREIQVIKPAAVPNATSSTTFGVGDNGVGAGNGVPGTQPAGNPGDDGYSTYYIPIAVGGVIAAGASVAGNALIAGNVL
jgi:hypothetical protein